MMAYWKIRARLLRVPGVANVAIWGERLKQVQVEVDPSRLRTERVALDDLMETTSDALDTGLLQFSEGHVVGTGGFVETPERSGSPSRTGLPIVHPSDLAQVPLARRGGQRAAAGRRGPRRRRAAAADRRRGRQRRARACCSSSRSCRGANTLDGHAAASSTRSTTCSPGLPGIDVDTTIFRPATFIETAIHNL